MSNYQPTPDDLNQCPKGCSKYEIELGSDQSSCMSVMGVPYKYIRCGECGFGDDNKSNPKLDLKEAVEDWNALVSKASLSDTEKSNES